MLHRVARAHDADVGGGSGADSAKADRRGSAKTSEEEQQDSNFCSLFAFIPRICSGSLTQQLFVYNGGERQVGDYTQLAL